LQVHKSTHHFDLVNWFLGDTPRTVSAQGSLAFYGGNGAFRGRRCQGCAHRRKCRFYFDLNADRTLREFYAAAESETGYCRDGCVFDEEIDIEDNFSVRVDYSRGARLTYSLQAMAPWEGVRLEIQGKSGALKYLETHGGFDWIDADAGRIVVMLNTGSRVYHIPPSIVDGHGGGDTVLQEELFATASDGDPRDTPGSMDAAYSMLIGVAVTKSIQNSGGTVLIADLLRE